MKNNSWKENLPCDSEKHLEVRKDQVLGDSNLGLKFALSFNRSLWFQMNSKALKKKR